MDGWFESLEGRQLLAAMPDLSASAGRLLFSDVHGTVSAPQFVTLRNTGSAAVSLKSISITGSGAGQFAVRQEAAVSKLKPGKSVRLAVTFAPSAAGVSGARLEVASDDPDTPVLSVGLRGLGLAGRFGDLEPSLQRVLDVMEIPVSVGDSNAATPKLDGLGVSDEITMPLLKKAGPGPVRLTMLASFSWDFNPVARFGWYRAKGRVVRRELFTLPQGQSQRLMPPVTGSLTFDPKSWTFGLYSSWLIEPHGDTFTQDGLNTWDTSADRGHKVRFYPYRTPTGRTVANTYVVAMEEGFNSDFEDAVMLIQNVAPFDAVAAPANVAARAVSANSIELTWADRSNNETSFVIERSGKKNGTYAIVGSVGAGVAVFRDTGLSANTRYYYRVRAVNATRSSGVSNRAVARTLAG